MTDDIMPGDEWLFEKIKFLKLSEKTEDPGAYSLSELSKAQQTANEIQVDKWPAHWFTTVEGCRLLRYTALSAMDLDGEDFLIHKNQAVLQYARRWVIWLTDDARRSRYLAETRPQDDAFYDKDRRIVKLRQGWNEEWQKKLKAIKNPERLTIGEFELALAIFNWDSADGKPSFADWVKQDRYILRRVHRFLLKQYCFELLPLFENARHGVEEPQRFVAAPHWKIYPRIGAMCAIGTLGLFGAGNLSKAFAPSWMATGSGTFILCGLILSIFAWGGLHFLSAMDLRRQIMDLPVVDFQLGSRISKLKRIFLYRGMAGSIVAEALLSVYEGPDATVMNLESIGHGLAWFVGILSRGAAIALTGALLQWFWDDRAATEPF